MKLFGSIEISSKRNLINALLAMFVLSAIVLGCTCKDGEIKWNSDSDSTSTDRPERTDDGPVDDGPATSDFKADEDTVPTREQSRALVLQTLNDFNDAVKKGDFSDFRETVSRQWRNTSKVSDFNKGFKQFIDRKIDVSRVNSSVPEFDPQPRIGNKYNRKILFLKGKYDTRPLPVRFELEYLVEDEQWKLIFIRVDTRK